MVTIRLSCPHCHCSLKPKTMPPIGVDILCPKCKTFFKLTPSLMNAATAPTPAPAGQLSANPDTPILLNSPQGAAPNRLILVTASIIVTGATLAILWLVLTPSHRPNEINEVPKAAVKPEDPVINLDLRTKKKQVKGAPLINLAQAEADEVSSMTKKGVQYLLKMQKPDGGWPPFLNWDKEVAPMCGLTLLECGIPPEDPHVQSAAKFVRNSVPTMTSNYGLALSVLFLDRLGAPADKKLISRVGLRMIAGQSAQGAFGYESPILSDSEADVLLTWLNTTRGKTWREFQSSDPKSASELPPRLRTITVFRANDDSTQFFQSPGGDPSNTQFALLALWTVRRHNEVPVDNALALVSKMFRATQLPAGSWSYTRGGLPSVSMSCAGLLGLAVGYGLDDNAAGKSPLRDPDIIKGLKYLGGAIPGLEQNPPIYFIYTMWSIERVGVLFNLPRIGDMDWYRWGMQILRVRQKPEGNWEFQHMQGFSAIIDTCFALLFLQQANLARDLSDKLEDMAGPMPVQVPVIRKQ